MSVLNFGAGPAKLPRPVLEQAQRELLDFHGTGMSIMEISHRSPEFETIVREAERDLRSLLSIPPNYHVLFLQGGATTQFSAVPLNLLPNKDATCDYIVTGAWSQKAAAEAKKYGQVHVVNADAAGNSDLSAPLSFSPSPTFLYYCANETIHGVEFPSPPVPPPGTLLVADMSSNILSRPIDVAKHAIVYAGAQKNIGCSGVTIVVVRSDLVGHEQGVCPDLLAYAIHAKHGSLYNTPPTWSIYIAGLVFKWALAEGGVEEFDRRSARKAGLLYDVIDGSDGFYSCPVPKHMRSRMNVPFRIGGGNKDLEKDFLAGAETKKMQQLAGHRSVGGIRASLYNAVDEEMVNHLVTWMRAFMEEKKGK